MPEAHLNPVALAATTQPFKIGTLVLCTAFRKPALLANIDAAQGGPCQVAMWN